MGRSKKGDIVNGWIALDKPVGITSTQAVGKVRRHLNARKIGHGGTLDPLASGILPIALGEATKTIPYIQDHRKTYRFTAQWGEQRSTDDLEGDVIATSNKRPTQAEIQAVLPRFTGDILQTPPQFSAIKIDGERAYDIARDGGEVDLKPRPVYIETFDLIEYSPDNAVFEVYCGKGTYIRSLARDMALALGTVGFVADLRRLDVGPLGPKNAISLDSLLNLDHSAALETALLPVETVLDGIPALELNQQEAARLKNGQSLSFISRPDAERLQRAGVVLEDGPQTALATCNGLPVALVDIEGVDIHPVRVLNL